MKIALTHVEEVDSSSSRVAEMLREGESAPFAVTTPVQTAGRGRRGRGWQSPRGNLYVSIALPAPDSSNAVETIPLKVAGVVGSWLEAQFKFRCTVKWPNDLLFAGRKLGGILCESSSSGSKQGEIIIGIGINLTKAPEVAGENLAISVGEIVGETGELKKLADSFVDHFASCWDEASKSFDLFHRYEMASGHLWTEKAGVGDANRVVYKGIDSAGKLTLASTTDDKEQKTISSVDHDWAWIYHASRADKFPLVVADIGNTNVKTALFRSSQDEASVSETHSNSTLKDDDLSSLTAELEKLAGTKRGWPVFIVSVSDPGRERFVEVCRSVGLSPVVLEKRPVLWRDGGYDITGLGIDRLAMIEAWLSRQSDARSRGESKTGVIVSSGTATTVDIVRSSGEHLGGVIFPGVQTGLDSLNKAASLLPSLSAKEIEPVVNKGVGANTKEAMEQGALQMTLGAIERIIDFHVEEHGLSKKDIEVCITGGNAGLLGPQLGSNPERGLVLHGARVMALGGFLG